jgi:site-specific DNA-methyltransferase (adenine-specific)
VEAQLVWDKGDSPGMGRVAWPFGVSYELIYVNGEGWSGTRRGGVLRVPHSSSVASSVGHPTPKPIALLELILIHAPAGAIADPFAGSGSTLVAAKNLGRRAIGVELEERYCEVIARRLSQGVLDLGGAA